MCVQCSSGIELICNFDLFRLFFLGTGFGFDGCVRFPGYDGGKVSQGANCKEVEGYATENS